MRQPMSAMELSIARIVLLGNVVATNDVVQFSPAVGGGEAQGRPSQVSAALSDTRPMEASTLPPAASWDSSLVSLSLLVCFSPFTATIASVRTWNESFKSTTPDFSFPRPLAASSIAPTRKHDPALYFLAGFP